MNSINVSKPKNFFTVITPLVGLYVAIACIVALATPKLKELNVNTIVVQTGNVLLFALSIINIKLLLNALKSKNPNASVQAVLLSTIIKLFVLGGAVFGYFILQKQQNIKAIIACMFFYILYTIVEKSTSMKIKK
jgi:hypothetical protein